MNENKDLKKLARKIKKKGKSQNPKRYGTYRGYRLIRLPQTSKPENVETEIEEED